MFEVPNQYDADFDEDWNKLLADVCEVHKDNSNEDTRQSFALDYTLENDVPGVVNIQVAIVNEQFYFEHELHELIRIMVYVTSLVLDEFKQTLIYNYYLDDEDITVTNNSILIDYRRQAHEATVGLGSLEKCAKMYENYSKRSVQILMIDMDSKKS